MKTIRSELNINPTVPLEDMCAIPGEEEFEKVTGLPYQHSLCATFKDDERLGNCTNIPYTGLPNSTRFLPKFENNYIDTV